MSYPWVGDGVAMDKNLLNIEIFVNIELNYSDDCRPESTNGSRFTNRFALFKSLI